MLRTLFLIAGVGCLVSSHNLLAQNVDSVTSTGPTKTADISNLNTEPVQEFRLSGEFMPDAPSSVKEDQHPSHGLLYGYRGWSDITPRAQLPLSQFGGALGGDIAHESTSYFVSFDQYGVNRRLLLLNLAERLGPTNTVLLGDANVLASSAFVARVDHKFFSADSAYLRFSRDAMHGNSLKTEQEAGLPGIAKGLNITQENAEAGNIVHFSPKTANESKAQFILTEVQVPAGLQALGLDAASPTVRRNHIFQAANNIYRQMNGQSLRMGGDFLYNQMNISFMQENFGRVVPSLSQSDKDVDAYVLGQKQLRPNLLVTAGMRYDMQALKGIKTDLNNFSPQTGFAWAPSSRTVIRGGLSMYYDRVPLPAFAGSTDPTGSSYLVRSAAIRNLGTTPLGDLGTFTMFSPTIQNSYAEHASLQAEQQLGSNSVLSAEYEYVRGVQLALPVHRTTALCAATDVCNSQSQVTGQVVGSGAVSTYNGFSVAFTQHPVHWGNYKIAYTYSKAEGSGTDMNDSYINDQMKRVSFTGVLHTSLDPGSTLWQRMKNGFLLSGTSDYFNRSEFLGMNFINLNARLTKNFFAGERLHVDGMVETFNVLQRTNAAYTKAAAELGERASDIFAVYKGVAALQNPGGSQIGLRMTF